MAITAFLVFVVPILLLRWVTTAARKSRAELLLAIWIATVYLAYLLLAARWDFFSVHLRYLAVALFVSAFVRSLLVARAAPRGRRPRLAPLIAPAGLALLLSFAAGRALAGRMTPAEAIDLEFPLNQGTYYIGGGGGVRLINGHQAYVPQSFAVDVVGLNRFGSRSNGWAPTDPARYPIWDDTVYAPCGGPVLVAVDGLPDQKPPETDSQNPAGNHIAVGCHGVKVVLAHLREGSVRVRVGSRVAPGEPIARVGNSGQTTQPHLHIHAERGGSDSGILDGVGVPILLGGRFLVRNDIVRMRS